MGKNFDAAEEMGGWVTTKGECHSLMGGCNAGLATHRIRRQGLLVTLEGIRTAVDTCATGREAFKKFGGSP